MHNSNKVLEADVREELDCDGVLDDSRIVVNAKDGVVTLSGTVIEVSNRAHTIYLDGTTSPWTAKREAGDVSWDAPGVTDVVNRIVVAP